MPEAVETAGGILRQSFTVSMTFDLKMCPLPERLTDGYVRIEMKAVGICGSDVHYWKKVSSASWSGIFLSSTPIQIAKIDPHESTHIWPLLPPLTKSWVQGRIADFVVSGPMVIGTKVQGENPLTKLRNNRVYFPSFPRDPSKRCHSFLIDRRLTRWIFRASWLNAKPVPCAADYTSGTAKQVTDTYPVRTGR